LLDRACASHQGPGQASAGVLQSGEAVAGGPQYRSAPTAEFLLEFTSIQRERLPSLRVASSSLSDRRRPSAGVLGAE